MWFWTNGLLTQPSVLPYPHVRSFFSLLHRRSATWRQGKALLQSEISRKSWKLPRKLSARRAKRGERKPRGDSSWWRTRTCRHHIQSSQFSAHQPETALLLRPPPWDPRFQWRRSWWRHARFTSRIQSTGSCWSTWQLAKRRGSHRVHAQWFQDAIRTGRFQRGRQPNGARWGAESWLQQGIQCSKRGNRQSAGNSPEKRRKKRSSDEESRAPESTRSTLAGVESRSRAKDPWSSPGSRGPVHPESCHGVRDSERSVAGWRGSVGPGARRLSTRAENQDGALRAGAQEAQDDQRRPGAATAERTGELPGGWAQVMFARGPGLELCSSGVWARVMFARGAGLELCLPGVWARADKFAGGLAWAVERAKGLESRSTLTKISWARALRCPRDRGLELVAAQEIVGASVNFKWAVRNPGSSAHVLFPLVQSFSNELCTRKPGLRAPIKRGRELNSYPLIQHAIKRNLVPRAFPFGLFSPPPNPKRGWTWFSSTIMKCWTSWRWREWVRTHESSRSSERDFLAL